jgi:hypothetical protein
MTSWLGIVDELYQGSWNPELQRYRSRFAYRGIGRADAPLLSSLARLARGYPRADRLEAALLRNFRKYAHGAAAMPDSIWHWLALGQHLGLPTRLIDWTYSPLIALHFATADVADFDVDGVVWCVDFVSAGRLLPRPLRELLEAEESDTLTVEMLNRFPTLASFDRLARRPFVVFLEPPTIAPRIRNQHALFSLMPSPGADLGGWLRQHPRLMRRIRIPARLKWEIRDKLDQAHINERVLYPGLAGLCRWLARYYTPRTRSGVPRV